jgi:hypothetical protein
MEKPVGNHIRELEERAERLAVNLLKEELKPTERNRLESDIQATNLALIYFREALELEKQIQTPW